MNLKFLESLRLEDKTKNTSNPGTKNKRNYYLVGVSIVCILSGVQFLL